MPKSRHADIEIQKFYNRMKDSPHVSLCHEETIFEIWFHIIFFFDYSSDQANLSKQSTFEKFNSEIQS